MRIPAILKSRSAIKIAAAIAAAVVALKVGGAGWGVALLPVWIALFAVALTLWMLWRHERNGP